MKKLIILFVILVTGILFVLNIKVNNKSNKQAENNTSDYIAEKSNTEINGNNITEIRKKEMEISTFSTKIYNKDEERQNNIGITCKTLSTKEIKPGEVFSFCNIVGKSTTEKGYKEADIYVNGKKEQGLGGGNCQVSTTLYNAVLKIPELEIIERHQHSGKVPYIQEGKDAAVAYGTYDFRFKNNSNNIIKIIMENTTDEVIAKLIKVEG